MRRKDRQVTDINEIESILKLCRTCHLGMIDGDIPYVVPLSIGYEIDDDDVLTLYFHSAYEGRKLDILKANNKVCFELCCEGKPLIADVPCNSGYFFSSVIGNGEALFVDDTEEKCRALTLIFQHQSGKDVEFTPAQAETVCIFKVISTDFTGKRKPMPSNT